MASTPAPNKSTRAGIVNTSSGERVVAASRRPDGSYRKELKIRPGFTPQEDVERFRSVRAEAQARALAKRAVPGLPSSSIADATASMSTLKLGDAVGVRKGRDNMASPESVALQGRPVPEASDEAKVGFRLSSTGSTSADIDREAAAQSEGPGARSDAPKRLNALREKLRQAETLRERHKRGLYLPPAERDKVQSIVTLTEEIARLSAKCETTMGPPPERTQVVISPDSRKDGAEGRTEVTAGSSVQQDGA